MRSGLAYRDRRDHGACKLSIWLQVILSLTLLCCVTMQAGDHIPAVRRNISTHALVGDVARDASLQTLSLAPHIPDASPTPSSDEAPNPAHVYPIPSSSTGLMGQSGAILGVAADNSGGFYVSVSVESGYSHVLYYPSGSTTATRVYGAPSVPGGIQYMSANSLTFAFGVATDKDGGLYIADEGNNRVLYYPSGSTTATRVYGQPSLYGQPGHQFGRQNEGGLSATSLSLPQGVATDKDGGLYIVDSGNNRVLYYPSGSTTATRVYGQPNFSSNTPTSLVRLPAAPTPTPSELRNQGFYQPRAVAVTSDGDVYVSDVNNGRILYYPPGSTRATRFFRLGAVYGLAVDGGGGLYLAAIPLLYLPRSSTTPTIYTTRADAQAVAVDKAGGIYVGDEGFHSGNDRHGVRVLYYPPQGSPPPSPSPPPASPSPPTNSRAIVFIHGIAGNYADTDREEASQRYTTFIHTLRHQFGLDNVIVFPYYQDLGYAHPPTDPTRPCAQHMPAADRHAMAEYPFVPILRNSLSPEICDSQGDLGVSALLLDDRLQQLARRYHHITLIANSMGGAITRGWLTIRQVAAQRTFHGIDLRAVDSVIFIQGAQQGSYLAGQFLCSPFRGLGNRPLIDAIIEKGAAQFFSLSSTRPAAFDLAPLSPWYDFADNYDPRRGVYDVPRGVHFYNFYTSERVHHYAAALWGRIEESTDDLGDLVMLPGSNAPGPGICGGGARFLPGSLTPNGDGAGRDSYQWQIANSTHDLIDQSPTNVFPEWTLQSDDIYKDPTNHIQLGTGDNMGLTYVADCHNHAPITITDQIERIIRDPIHVCDSGTHESTFAASKVQGGTSLSPRSVAVTDTRRTTHQRASPLSSTQACCQSQASRPQKYISSASPSIFTDRSGAHLFSVQLRPGAAPIGSFHFAIGRVGQYDGVAVLRRRGTHDIELHQTLQVRFSSGHRTMQVVHVRLDGHVDPILHTATITLRLLNRRGVVYRLVTERITAASARPVAHLAETVFAHNQWGSLYNILPDEIQHLYTRTQFVRMAQGSIVHSPTVLRLAVSGTATIATSNDGLTLYRQPLRVTARSRTGHVVTFMSNLYLVRENGAWRFWTTDTPPAI